MFLHWHESLENVYSNTSVFLLQNPKSNLF